MKKRIIVLLLILGVIMGAFCQSSGPMDLVLLLDVSASMSNSYWETSDYLIGPFLKEFLRIGDTFHLISYAGTPRVEISRRIQASEDVEAVIGRLLLMYPLDTQSDLSGALAYAENYSASLPGSRPRKIILVSDADVPGAENLVSGASSRLSRQGSSLQFIKVPVSGSGPSSGRPSGAGTLTAAQTAQVSSQASQTRGASSSAQTAQTAQPATGRDSSPGTGTAAASSGTQTQPAGASSGGASSAGTSSASTSTAGTSAGGASSASAGTSTASAGGVSSGSASSQSPAASGSQTSSSGTSQSSAQTSQEGRTADSSSQTSQGAAGGVGTAGTTGTASSTDTTQSAAQTQSASQTQTSQGTQAAGSGASSQSSAQGGQSSQTQQTQTQQSESGGGSLFGGDIPLPLIIGLILLALLLLGLIIFFATRHLQSSPNRVMAQAAAPMDNSERMEAQRQEQIKGAELMGSYAKSQKNQPKPMPKDKIDEEPVSDVSDGPPMLNLFVEDQNTAIGRRNIHNVKAGYTFSVGGGKSDFLIFLVPIPPHIADVHYDGRNCTFIPRKAKYFPDIGSQQVSNCIGKNIRVLSDKNYELHIRIDRYQDPLKALNKLLHSISVPGEVK